MRQLRIITFNPKTEAEWGAHAPRVPFSAPSRKTLSALKNSRRSGQSHAQGAGREARPAAPEGGRAPQLLFSGLTRIGGVLIWRVGPRCNPTRLAARVVPPLKLEHSPRMTRIDANLNRAEQAGRNQRCASECRGFVANCTGRARHSARAVAANLMVSSVSEVSLYNSMVAYELNTPLCQWTGGVAGPPKNRQQPQGATQTGETGN